MLITFEGGDGSGKSTQAALLADRLRRDGYGDVVLLREPGGTELGEVLGRWMRGRVSGARERRMTPVAEMFLFAAARAQMVRRVVEPALGRPDAVVICDRYMDSTTAYQGYGRQLGAETVRLVNEIAVGTAVPDMTILLDLAPEEARERLVVRRDDGLQPEIGGDAAPEAGGSGPGRGPGRPFEDESAAFRGRVRAGYLEMADADPARWRKVEAALPEREISDRVRAMVDEVLVGIPAARDAGAGYQGSLFEGGE